MKGHYDGMGIDRSMMHAMKAGNLASNVSTLTANHKSIRLLDVEATAWWTHRYLTISSYNSAGKPLGLPGPFFPIQEVDSWNQQWSQDRVGWCFRGELYLGISITSGNRADANAASGLDGDIAVQENCHAHRFYKQVLWSRHSCQTTRSGPKTAEAQLEP